PMAIQAVHDVARALPETPILGVGGIALGRDAVEFLLAGAWAVQVGTALLSNPTAAVEVAQGVMRFLAEQGLSSVADLRGRLGSAPRTEPVAAVAGGATDKSGQGCAGAESHAAS